MTSTPCHVVSSRESDLAWRDVAIMSHVSQGALFTYTLDQPVLVQIKLTGEHYMLSNATVGLYSRFADNHGLRYTYFYKN